MQHAYSVPSGTFSSTSLKRTRSGELPCPPSELPRLPIIDADLILEVYIHQSLRPPNATKPEEFTDNSRLAKLGEVVLDTAVTFALFKKRPFLTGAEIKDHTERILSNDVLQGWVKSYQMATRILCLAEFKSKREEPEMKGTAMWVRNTPTPTRSLDIPPAKKIKNEPTNSSLISLAALSPTPSSSSTAASTSTSTSSSSQVYSPTAPYLNTPQSYPSAYTARQVPPHMPSKSSYPGTSSSGTQMANLFPTNTTNFNALFQSLTKLSQSPALRAVTASQSQKAQSMLVDGKSSNGHGIAPSLSRPNPLAPATPNAPFLPLFNQSATQRGVKVDYSAEFAGPAHAGQWSVECLVNGIPKGKGKGSSKQIAKEEAARQAYYSMGWT
ncbi:hypothetical protein AN958_10858 [Leucoagaricus sp. SymC.cos]|nr:hypothetical protein AN958_10858 [Leucoagaricus sp. SymC.cos]